MTLLAKVNTRGTVWTSRYVAYNVLGYQMEAIGSRKHAYAVLEPIMVRPAEDGEGWDILLYGDVVHSERYKTDAQREAEKLLDNPRDRSGYLVEMHGGRWVRR